MVSTKNFYAILGLPQGAGRREVARAWKALAMATHPDKIGARGTAAMADLNRIKWVLTDESMRRAYDAWLLWKERNPRVGVTPPPFRIGISREVDEETERDTGRVVV